MPRKPRSSARHDRRSVIDALLALPAHVRSRLSIALESGLLVPPYSEVAVRSTVGGEHQDAIVQVLREWERIDVSPEAGVIWLNSLARAADRAPAPDFVWTGPEVVGLHARDTRRVYEELIGSARHSIWVCSYAFFDGPRAFATLAARMDANPGLEVTLLLNIERRRGDTTAADTLVRRCWFADKFWGEAWPGQAESPEGVLRSRACRRRAGRPRRRPPCQGRGGGRGIGVHHLREPDRGCIRPQHRAGTGGAATAPFSRDDGGIHFRTLIEKCFRLLMSAATALVAVRSAGSGNRRSRALRQAIFHLRRLIGGEPRPAQGQAW